jgi:FKBP-type peptidyl-prolyl cis-trans isomerase
VTFDPSLGVNLSAMTKLASGVYIEDRVVGSGAVIAAGDHLWTTYSGWLRTGFLFDSGEYDFDFQATPPQVIAGWDLGLVGMAEGGTRLLVIPYQYGYGETGFGPIPGGAVLVFEVQLDSIT